MKNKLWINMTEKERRSVKAREKRVDEAIRTVGKENVSLAASLSLRHYGRTLQDLNKKELALVATAVEMHRGGRSSPSQKDLSRFEVRYGRSVR